MRRDLLWLIFTLIGVALAVYWTPTSVKLPLPPVLATAPAVIPSATPDYFDCSCTGSRHEAFRPPCQYRLCEWDPDFVANP